MKHSLCGQCLHSVENHTPDNGFFMYCSACQSLCSIDEYNIIHKPSDISTVMQLAVKREYSDYIPKEIKNKEKQITKLEKDKQEELWREYS